MFKRAEGYFPVVDDDHRKDDIREMYAHIWASKAAAYVMSSMLFMRSKYLMAL